MSVFIFWKPLRCFKAFIGEDFSLSGFIPGTYSYEWDFFSRISCLETLLFVYRKAMDLSMLTLYSTTLSKTLNVSNLQMTSEGAFRVFHVMSSPNKDKLTSSFPVCITLFPFLLWLHGLRLQAPPWVKWGSGHALSRSLFTWKCFDVSVPPVDLLSAAFIRLRYCLILLVFSELLSWRDVLLCQRSSRHLLRSCGFCSWVSMML